MLDLVAAGLALVLAGLAVVAFVLLSGSGGTKEGVKGGGVVMIGPIPIVFGSDWRWASVAIALALVLVVVYALGALW